MWTYVDYDSLKTFNEIIEEQTQDIVFADSSIDEATQAAIIKWFGFRKVCDNEKFVTYFNRLLLQRQDQYNNLLRIQTIKFDPLVTSYLERLIDRSGTTSLTQNNTSNGTASATRTDNLKGTSSVTSTGSDTASGTQSTESTTTNNLTDTSSINNSHKEMSAQLPQSSTTSSGFPSSLNWTYATAQGESAETNSETDTHKGTVSTTGSTTTSSEATNTTTTTGNTTNTGTQTNETTTTGTETSNTSGTTGDITKERYTGRNGNAPDLMQKAVNFIMTTNCFFWLCDNLECCFMTNFDD